MFSEQSGLLISIGILIALMLICHTSNFLFPRNNFINLAIPHIPTPTQYNKIYYNNNDNRKKIPCISHPEIPCSLQTSCLTKPDNSLSDSEIAVFYKFAYENAGAEVLRRALYPNETSPTPTTTPSIL